MPEQVRSGSTIKAYYLYDATGRKLNTRNPAQTTSYDYLGSLVLAQVNGAWSGEVNFGEGVIRSNGEVTYFEKDHLGSVRVVLNADNPLDPVLERNDYSPFGSRWPTASYPILAANRYKFNGKENLSILSESLLDYGARLHDSYLRRWMTIDPLAEQRYAWSPYAFSSGNPIVRVDPDGRADDWYFNEEGEYLGQDNQSTDNVRIMNQADWEQHKNEEGNRFGDIYGIYGLLLAEDFSKAGLSDEASLRVYNHFNMTGLEPQLGSFEKPYIMMVDPTIGGQQDGYRFKGASLYINVERNRRSGLFDNAYNIISSFEHENFHLRDARERSQWFRSEALPREREHSALQGQMNSPTFPKTTREYQRHIQRMEYNNR